MHKQAIGETSLRLTIFTDQQGLLRVTYRGGRTSKKQALLQAFTLLWVELDPRSNHYIRHLECNTLSVFLIGKSLFSALYVNELLSYTQCVHEPNIVLYNAYVDTLHKLAQTDNQSQIERILRHFELKWLAAQGYALALSNEIDAKLYYVFIPDQGFIAAQRGYLGAHIIALQAGYWDTSEVLHILKIITRSAIQHALGGRLIKTRAIYSTLCSH